MSMLTMDKFLYHSHREDGGNTSTCEGRFHMWVSPIPFPYYKPHGSLTSSLDDGVTLIIWMTAETAVTVIATSLTVLRSLILGFKEQATRAVSTDEWTHKKSRLGQTSAT